MRICYLADGQSIHTQRWCRHFASLGHDVHLITLREVQIDQCTVHTIPAGSIKVSGGNMQVLWKAGAVRKLIRLIQPDIVHALYATSYGYLGARSGFHPYVMTALGTDVLISPQSSFLYKRLVQYVFKRADWMTAMADHMKEVMIGLGAEPSKVDTVIFGIDTELFHDRGRTLSNDAFVITSTRNLEPVYNIPLLLEAVVRVRSQIPELRVELIGQGSLKEQLQQQVHVLQLDDCVNFLGRVPQSVIAEALRRTHLFISTSLSDGNNVSLNEAMACGAFCIATDIPANRQWLINGENGYLVPTDDPEILATRILEVYRNYNKMSEKAKPINQQMVQEKGDWAHNMKQVEVKYTELINTWRSKK